jgi:hypothetical protein
MALPGVGVAVAEREALAGHATLSGRVVHAAENNAEVATTTTQVMTARLRVTLRLLSAARSFQLTT